MRVPPQKTFSKFKLVAEDVEKPIIKILSMPIEHGKQQPMIFIPPANAKRAQV